MPRNEPTQLEEQIFDLRIIERRLRDRRTERKEYEAFLAGLPDEEANVDYMEVKIDEASSGTGADNDLTFTSG